VTRLRPRIEEIADGLLPDLAEQDSIDLIGAYAAPLPMTVICEVLGVPESRRAGFREATKMASTPDRLAEGARNLVTYMDELVTAKRARPTGDLLSDLVAISDGGDQLSHDELISTGVLLVVAGHESTVNLIANGVLALLRSPGQLGLLRDSSVALTAAIEELLRYAGPAHIVSNRFTAEPVVIGGVEIPAGEFVLVSLASANRDEQRFGHADELDLTRDAGGHVAFGHGIHHCLGAPLARLEGQIAIGRLIERFPGLRLAADPRTMTWRPSSLMHALTELPVATR
jgi:cytochrome P450